MNDIRAILKTAATRLAMNAYLRKLHVVAIVVASIALALVLVEKLTALDVPWMWVAPALTVVALAVTAILWMRHRASEQHVAIEVDDRLGLREKLSTALHLGDRDDAFARAAVEDAVNVARQDQTREKVRRLFPIVMPNRWWVAPAMIMLAVLCTFALPQTNLFASDEKEIAINEAPSEVAESLQVTVEEIKQNEELAEELKDVFEELDPTKLNADALKSPDGARREAIKKLSDLSKRLEEITEGEKGKTAEALQKAMRQLKTPDDGIAKELADAMADGNFEKAKKALEDLQEQVNNGEMSDEKKEEVAKQLEEMAQQMQNLAENKQALEDALAKAGMDKNLANNPQQLQQQLQNNQNLTKQQKQQLQQMVQAQQQANQMCQGMGQAMSQMAQGMSNNGQGSQQQMSQGASDMSQMLSDAESMSQMLKQAQAMANKLQGQCQGLGQGLSMKPKQGKGGMGRQPGQGQGGEAPIAKTPTRSKLEQANNQDNEADVIANTLFDGPLIKGESQAQFKNAAMSAAESYADSVSDDQLPRKYHQAVRRYFGDMKEKAESATADENAEDASSDDDE